MPDAQDEAPAESSQRQDSLRDARVAVLLALALAAALVLLGYRLFLAQPSEAAWAGCLWREVPTSAANWLAMDLPDAPRGAGDPLPAELLKARLLGACAGQLAPLGSALADAPNWSGLFEALASRQPAQPIEDRTDPRAFVCEVYFADDAGLRDVAEHDWGHGDFNTGPVIGRRSHYEPSRHYGQTLTTANSVRFCRLIGPDGRPSRDRFQRAPLPDRATG